MDKRTFVTPEEREMFFKAFGFHISTVWDKLYGLDIISFEKKIEPSGGTPDGTSLAMYIEDKHGKEAMCLIKSLLDIVPISALLKR